MNPSKAIFPGIACLVLSLTWSARAGVPDQPTFTRDVAPILFENCTGCHRPGEIGPMPFQSYTDVRPWAKSIKEQVVRRKMPPWGADPSHGIWANDVSLSEDEIETIARWVDRGAPMGDPADRPPLPEYPDPNAWKLGEPDVIVEFEAITVPALSDGYWGPTAPLRVEEGQWIRGIEIIPSNPSVAHHIVIYAGDYAMSSATARRDADGKSYREEKQEGAPEDGIAGGMMLGSRGAGGQPGFLPDGVGRPLRKVDKLTGEFHFYNQEDFDQTCSVKVGLHFGRGEMQKEIALNAPSDFNVYIPYGEEGVQARGYYVFDQDAYLYTLTPHFHILGRDMTYTAVYPDGSRETLLHTPDLDFNWQIAYRFAEPKFVPAGTRVEMVGHFRNPADSPDHQPDQPVLWGYAAFDEMAFGIMTFWPAEGVAMRPPKWLTRIDEYMTMFPDPKHHRGTIQVGFLRVPAVLTIADGETPTLRLAMPGAVLGNTTVEVRFTEASWEGDQFEATTPPGGFFGGTVTLSGSMNGGFPEAEMTLTDLVDDMGGLIDKPWLFTTQREVAAE